LGYNIIVIKGTSLPFQG